MIGILFEKIIVDDSGFPRTPDRPVELLGTRVRYSRSVKTSIGARGPDCLGGSATINSLKVTHLQLPIDFISLGESPLLKLAIFLASVSTNLGAYLARLLNA